MKFPMPNDKLTLEGFETIVVASVWYREEPTEMVTILTLNKVLPYFSVFLLEADGDEWNIIDKYHEFNIILAIKRYEQLGGDL